MEQVDTMDQVEAVPGVEDSEEDGAVRGFDGLEAAAAVRTAELGRW